MANHINMGEREAIARLYEGGWKKRRIARELGLDRKTVRRHILALERSKGTISPAGDGGSKGTILHAGDVEAKGTILHAGKSMRPGRPSRCEPHKVFIESAVEAGLCGQRIYQDLKSDHGFEGAYDAVKRYVRRLYPQQAQRIWRMESPPGEEAQVDFGAGAWIIGEQGRKRRSYIFRIVLSYSRKAYSEAVFQQDTETFIRCLENAFRYFGGVPQTLTIDNLRAAVKRADWYDPELNPKLIEFGRHYGVVILPTMPYTPQHKGKVENSVKYVKNNALKGRTFCSLDAENRHLWDWEAQVADKRIHGTTRQQVCKLFEQEKPALKALPASLFPCYQEGRRRVHRDSFVEIAKAYYEAPPEYIGQEVWARWDAHLVRLFNRHHEQIRVLARKRPGEFSGCLGTRGRSADVEHTVAYWRGKALKLGEHCGLWADRIIDLKGDHGIRTLQGLVALTRTHRAEAVDEGCRLALANGRHHLEDIRQLMKHPVEQNQFEFLATHPLIRDMAEYREIFQAMTMNAAAAACGGPDADLRDGASGRAAVPPLAASSSTHKQEEAHV